MGVPPQRIVSLVPSLTELVAWLGAADRLVGRTKFCTEPPGAVGRIPAVGGTKNPDIAAITAVRPDLVIANREENRREDVEALRAAGIEVLVTGIDTVGEAVEAIRELGELLGAAERADQLARDITAALDEGQLAAGAARKRVYAGVWHNPMMGLGAGTYGHSLLEACGAANVLGERERYPEVTMEAVRALKPDLILLPDEPFPFDEGHAALYGAIAPARVIDGKLLWWYGPRMPGAIRELRRILAEAGER